MFVKLRTIGTNRLANAGFDIDSCFVILSVASLDASKFFSFQLEKVQNKYRVVREKCATVLRMASLNVAEWTPEQVAEWLSGECDCGWCPSRVHTVDCGEAVDDEVNVVQGWARVWSGTRRPCARAVWTAPSC